MFTDLRTVWFFNARDFFCDEKPFADLPLLISSPAAAKPAV